MGLRSVLVREYQEADTSLLWPLPSDKESIVSGIPATTPGINEDSQHVPREPLAV